jgi:hypothetical protein
MIKEITIKHLSKIAYSVTVIEEDWKAYSFPFDYLGYYDNLWIEEDTKSIVSFVIWGIEQYKESLNK